MSRTGTYKTGLESQSPSLSLIPVGSLRKFNLYSFAVLGLFGFMEKLDILDKFFDHTIVRGWLHVLGIHREMYKRRVERAVRKAKARINGVKR